MLKTIKYHQASDYLIPNIIANEEKIHIGMWGIRRKNYLLTNNRVLFSIMLADGTLWKHLSEIDKQAEEMFSRLVDEMAQAEGVTEEFKAKDQIAWVCAMNNIRQRVIEIINRELICC